jgi:hypothetical protein
LSTKINETDLLERKSFDRWTKEEKTTFGHEEEQAKDRARDLAQELAK